MLITQPDCDAHSVVYDPCFANRGRFVATITDGHGCTWHRRATQPAQSRGAEYSLRGVPAGCLAPLDRRSLRSRPDAEIGQCAISYTIDRETLNKAVLQSHSSLGPQRPFTHSRLATRLYQQKWGDVYKFDPQNGK